MAMAGEAPLYTVYVWKLEFLDIRNGHLVLATCKPPSDFFTRVRKRRDLACLGVDIYKAELDYTGPINARLLEKFTTANRHDKYASQQRWRQTIVDHIARFGGHPSQWPMFQPKDRVVREVIPAGSK